jgi:serine/threonine protein kinase
LIRILYFAGVIAIEDYFELPDCYMIVMERVGDPACNFAYTKDLFDFISDHRRMSDVLAKHVFRQLVDALVQVDEAGVVHRDIKDENILIDTRTFQIKLIDFGSGAKLHNYTYSDYNGKAAFSGSFLIARHFCKYLGAIHRSFIDRYEA